MTTPALHKKSIVVDNKKHAIIRAENISDNCPIQPQPFPCQANRNLPEEARNPNGKKELLQRQSVIIFQRP